MKATRVKVLGMAAIIAAAGPALGCQCAPRADVDREFARSDAVFVGTATSGPYVENGMRATSFRTDRVYKGAVPPTVAVFTGGAGTCGWTFVPGTQYLVYSSPRGPRGVSPWTTICHRTREVAAAAADLLALERLLHASERGARP